MIANINFDNMAAAKQSNVKDNRARILLVDDHAVVRFGIAQLINRQADLVVCGEEEDASRAMNAIQTLKPARKITAHAYCSWTIMPLFDTGSRN